MRSFCLVVVSVFLAVAAGSARADEPWAAVIESYGGVRPADATRVLQPVFDELAKRDYHAGADVVGRRFESRASRLPYTGVGLPANFVGEIEAAHKEFINGRHTQARDILVPLVDAARQNQATFVKQPQLRDNLFKALTELGLSQAKIGDQQGVDDAFHEIVRSFPGKVVDSKTYGSAAQVFEDSKARLVRAGKGTLDVTVRSGGEIWINERLAGTGQVKEPLHAGEYRVFARNTAGQLSRVHRVTVVAPETTLLTIDVKFDATVHSTPAWSGLSFATSKDRENLEAKYAANFAHSVDATSLLVVGIGEEKGKRVVFGALINLHDATTVRRASVAYDSAPSEESLRGLARFLFGERAPPGVVVHVASDLPPPVDPNAERPDVLRDDESRPLWGGYKWIAAGVAVAGLATGGILLGYDGKCDVPGMNPCANNYQTAKYAWPTLAASGLVAGLAVYLFVRSDGSPPRRTAWLAPADGGGAIAGYRVSF